MSTFTHVAVGFNKNAHFSEIPLKFDSHTLTYVSVDRYAITATKRKNKYRSCRLEGSGWEVSGAQLQRKWYYPSAGTAQGQLFTPIMAKVNSIEVYIYS